MFMSRLYENELVQASRDIEEEKVRVFINVSMLSRQLSVSIPPLHQPIVYLSTYYNESSNTFPCFSLAQPECLSKHLFSIPALIH
jgi:hypothetical protein